VRRVSGDQVGRIGARARLHGGEGEDVDAQQRGVEDKEQEGSVVALEQASDCAPGSQRRARAWPMVVPTQGQWWSNFSTQSLETEQWCARGGW
jgi:hypothetical protein